LFLVKAARVAGNAGQRARAKIVPGIRELTLMGANSRFDGEVFIRVN
jgi:hypothetical protein